MADLIQIAAFMKKRIPAFRKCNRPTLLGYLNFHAARHEVAYVEEDGKVIAAGVARPVSKEILALMQSEYMLVKNMAQFMTDEEATLVYSDHVACKYPRALGALVLAMKCRFPNAREILFRKKSRRYKMKSYNLDRFLKIALRKSTMNTHPNNQLEGMR